MSSLVKVREAGKQKVQKRQGLAHTGFTPLSPPSSSHPKATPPSIPLPPFLSRQTPPTLPSSSPSPEPRPSLQLTTRESTGSFRLLFNSSFAPLLLRPNARPLSPTTSSRLTHTPSLSTTTLLPARDIPIPASRLPTGPYQIQRTVFVAPPRDCVNGRPWEVPLR